MDWNAAIEQHRDALRRIVVTLFAMAGLQFFPQHGALPQKVALAENPTLPRHLHRAILRLLRPAESAARRLIIAAPRNVTVSSPRQGKGVMTPPPLTLKGEGDSETLTTLSPLRGSEGRARQAARPGQVRGGGSMSTGRPPTLPLFDRLPSPSRPQRPTSNSVPRISLPGYTAPFVIPVRHSPSPSDPLNAARLTLRLQALAAAVDDLPRQARRFARWRNRNQQHKRTAAPSAKSPRRSRRIWPLRGGRPPGAHNARRHPRAVDDVLKAAHGLAFWALESPDTS
jgi:hypothetical protein